MHSPRTVLLFFFTYDKIRVQNFRVVVIIMEESRAVQQMINIVKKWDPFEKGESFYETEPVDVVRAVYLFDDPLLLGKEIQAIYELSFDQQVPLSECEKIAGDLLAVKEKSTC
jgi:hypothetical protein